MTYGMAPMPPLYQPRRNRKHLYVVPLALVSVVILAFGAWVYVDDDLRNRLPLVGDSIWWDGDDLSIDAVAGTGLTVTLPQLRGDIPESAETRIDGQLGKIATIAQQNGETAVAVEVPSDPGEIRGTVVVVDGGTNLVDPLDVTLRITAPDATEIPEEAPAPVTTRIVREAAMPIVAEEVMVTIEGDDEEQRDARAREVAAEVGGAFVGSVRSLGVYQIRITGADTAKLSQALDEIRAMDGVVAAGFVTVSGASDIPTDDSEARGEPLEQIRVTDVWRQGITGKGVKVGVIDTGFDLKQEDLKGRIVESKSYPWSKESDDHGTHVAGTVCAEGDNGKGVVGVAYDCDLSTFELGNTFTSVQLYSAMHDAVRSGVRVANISLGASLSSMCREEMAEEYEKEYARDFNLEQCERELADGKVDYRKYSYYGSCDATSDDPVSRGIREQVDAENIAFNAVLSNLSRDGAALWVMAAGNDDVDAGACHPRTEQRAAPILRTSVKNPVLLVGATRVGSDEKATYSNFGDAVDVWAPGGEPDGTQIRSSVDCASILGLRAHDCYGEKAGTSMATPHVAGAAALMLQKSSDLRPGDLWVCIMDSRRDGKYLDVTAAVECAGDLAGDESTTESPTSSTSASETPSESTEPEEPETEETTESEEPSASATPSSTTKSSAPTSESSDPGADDGGATGIVMADTQRMSEPTLESDRDGTYEEGRKLTLVCYRRGQSVTGYYSDKGRAEGAWSDIWYQTSDGSYVADIDVSTGTNDPVTKECD